MDLDNIKIFVAVMQQGSFAQAARQLEMDPSIVSRSIAALEAEFGFRLFQRSTRKLSPTESGAIYFAHVSQIISELDQARTLAADANSKPTGSMRITTSVAFAQLWLIPRLPRLKEALPELKLDIVISDANIDLIAERIDLAIRLGPRVDSGFVSTTLMPTRYKVLASPAYLKKINKSLTLKQPKDIEHHNCVLLSLSGYRAKWLYRTYKTAQVNELHVHGTLTLSTPLGVLEAVRSGMGPAMLADWMIQPLLDSGELIDVFPKHQFTATDFETAVRLMYPSRAYLPNKVRAVIDFLKTTV
jgi:DNA-binding transcriptional LysR family regulator